MPPKGKKPAPASKKKASPSPPSWPPFRPQLPVVELGLETVVRSKIMVARKFWPKSLCRNYVSFLNELPLTTTPGKPKRGDAVRVNDRFQIDDSAFAVRLWTETGLKDLINQPEYLPLWGGEVVGLNPNIRIYRYTKGQFFDCHYDDYNLVTLDSARDDDNGNDQGGDATAATNTITTTTPVSCKTTWTLLLYLTSAADGCIGGETVFYPNDRQLASEEIAVSLETGMLLLHKHGEDCMLHEGREVMAGEKWVVRSDLCIRR